MGKNYATKEELDTPYRRARQVVDERIGSARKQAFSWRVFGLGALVVALAAVVGLIYQSSKASVIPYVVEVDGQGAVRLVGSPATQTWTPSESVRRHFLEEWLLDVRELSSDKAVVREDLLQAYEGVTSKAKAQLDTMIEKTKPFEKIGKETRQLKVESINKISDDSYRVEWVETVFGKSGYVDRTERYVGIFSLLHRKPKTKAELERNALGIYVQRFSINERATGTSDGKKQKKSNGQRDEGGQK